MNLAKRSCALLLALILLLCAGCGEQETTKKKKKKVVVVRNPATSQNDGTGTEAVTSDNNSTYDDFSDYDYYETVSEEDTVSSERRELAVKKTTITENYQPEYTVKAVNWVGPTGYKIVYPKGNIQLKNSAIKLRDYFKSKAGVTLEVVDDSVKATDKEILVGNTNRMKSSLNEKKYGVSLNGNKLFFESGNFNGVMKAVKWFVSLGYQKGKVNLVDGEYDFVSTVKRDSGTFNFVWGDDFDGNVLDSANWDLTEQMGTHGGLEYLLSKDEKNISVSEGKLKLSATKYLDPRNSNIKYAATYTVASRYKMNFQYGYMEMCARYPVKQGAWPSWWLVGDCADGPAGKAFPSLDDIKNAGNIFKTTFYSEVDILEYTLCTPNLHKWYFDGAHSQLNAVKPSNSYGLTESDSYIYHVFGFEWNYNEIKIYCDGNLFQSYDLSTSYDSSDDMMDFRNPMLVFFNNHILPDSIPSDHSSLPFDYYVDYIRLYQKSGEGGLWLTELE